MDEREIAERLRAAATSLHVPSRLGAVAPEARRRRRGRVAAGAGMVLAVAALAGAVLALTTGDDGAERLRTSDRRPAPRAAATTTIPTRRWLVPRTPQPTTSIDFDHLTPDQQAELDREANIGVYHPVEATAREQAAFDRVASAVDAAEGGRLRLQRFQAMEDQGKAAAPDQRLLEATWVTRTGSIKASWYQMRRPEAVLPPGTRSGDVSSSLSYSQTSVGELLLVNPVTPAHPPAGPDTGFTAIAVSPSGVNVSVVVSASGDPEGPGEGPPTREDARRIALILARHARIG